VALTDTALRQAKPKEKAYTVAEGDGLAVLCLSRLYRRRVEEN
jgi:hypothetical protein